MPSLSYSELLGLVIAGAFVLFPLTRTEPANGPADAWAAAASSANGSDAVAPFVCPRTDGP